jgi:uncharacterized protein (TIGR00288 family)
MSGKPSTTWHILRQVLYSSVHWLIRRGKRVMFAWTHPPRTTNNRTDDRERISRVDSVAVLIDGDNIPPNQITQILLEAGKLGAVVLRQVYGNWASPTMQPWKDAAIQYGIKTMQQVQMAAGKNATDIALVVDAMDLLYTREYNHFCLVTSDSDYTPLVLRLRASGCIVMGIGSSAVTSVALAKACTMFIYTENLAHPSPMKQKTPRALTPSPLPVLTPAPVPGAGNNHLPTTPIPIPIPVPTSDGNVKLNAKLAKLLTDAYIQTRKDTNLEWISVPRLAWRIKLLETNFKATSYGYKNLPTLIRASEEIFELNEPAEVGGHIKVRLLHEVAQKSSMNG